MNTIYNKELQSLPLPLPKNKIICRPYTGSFVVIAEIMLFLCLEISLGCE